MYLGTLNCKHGMTLLMGNLSQQFISQIAEEHLHLIIKIERIKIITYNYKNGLLYFIYVIIP